jgi:hypothetical protein
MLSRKFQGHELMMIVGTPRGRQRFITDCVIAGIAWEIVALSLTTRTDRSVALQV